ncbi:MAG: hypothetical protein KJ804_01415 [Proteobacteria bacterium]|nr:hypothetical protein [Pseudomonadota bacterium]MBU1056969.1 hypothetical protein [Pseudomonadota bacterium]
MYTEQADCSRKLYRLLAPLLVDIIFLLAAFSQGMIDSSPALVAIPRLSHVLESKETAPHCILTKQSRAYDRSSIEKRETPGYQKPPPEIIVGSTLLKYASPLVIGRGPGITLI